MTKASVAGIEVKSANVPSPRHLYRSISALSSTLASFKPDTVLAHLTASEVIAPLSGLAARKTNLRYARVVHLPRLSRVQRLVAPLYKKTFVVSQEGVRVLKGLGVDARYVRNGLLHCPIPAPATLPTKQELSLAIVGHFRGGVSGSKGLDIALRALQLLIAARPAKLHVFGMRADEVPLLDSLTTSLGINDHVVNHGIVSDLPSALIQINTHIALMPSRIEGESIALMEYSTLGIPVVLSDITSFREMFEQQFDWTFFPSENPQSLADAILKRVGSPWPDTHYRTAAIDKFNMKKTIDEYEAVLQGMPR